MLSLARTEIYDGCGFWEKRKEARYILKTVEKRLCYHFWNSFSQFTITATGRTISTDWTFCMSNIPDRKAITCIVFPKLKIDKNNDYTCTKFLSIKSKFTLQIFFLHFYNSDKRSMQETCVFQIRNDTRTVNNNKLWLQYQIIFQPTKSRHSQIYINYQWTWTQRYPLLMCAGSFY